MQTTSNNADELTHLLHGGDGGSQLLRTVIDNDKKKNQNRWDIKGLWLIRLVLGVLVVTVLSVLGRIPLSVFSLHPLFMTTFIVLLTEGIATLQPTQTQNEKRQGLRRHTIIQLTGFVSGIFGFSAIFLNKILSNKSHFTSIHGKLGISVIIYLITQTIFGVVCAYVPGLSPTVKKLWKYHRLSGYILLSLVWITAIFGLQADYVVANTWLIPSFILLSPWSFLVVVVVIFGITLRIRPYKLEGQVYMILTRLAPFILNYPPRTHWCRSRYHLSHLWKYQYQRYLTSPPTKTLRTSNSRTQLNQHDPSNLPSSALREYQERCISVCIEKLKLGVKRQVVSLPVGSGKTVVMANLIPSVPNPTPVATKSLVLAHRTELLEQAQRQIQRFNPSLRVSIEQGRRKVDVENTDVIVASVQTLGRAGSNRLDNYDPTLFKTIMIDEAHHAAASTYTRILDHFGATQPDTHIFIWGCSATVRRHDGISLSNAFSDIAFHMDFLEMIESKWLSPLRITTVETSVDLSNVGIQQQDFKQGELSQAVNVSERNDIIVRSWRKYAQMDELGDDTYTLDHFDSQQRKATLVFAVDIAHTLALCNHFRQNGYMAEYVTSKTPTLTRYDILDRFRKGQFPILVNCGILTEGTDIPSIDCVLMARPTRSAVLFQQMFGRGMRLSPGKKDCLVIDFVDNFKRSGLVTFPTLMGLDPKTIIQDEDVLQLEQKAIEADKQKDNLDDKDHVIADIPTNGDQDSVSHLLRLKITEYDTMQEFMTTCSGIDRNIRQISTNAWVTIGDQYALAVLGEGLVTLSQQNDGTWTGIFQRQKQYKHPTTTTNDIHNNDGSNPSGTTTSSKQKSHGKFIIGRKTAIPLEADTLVTAVQAADTWIRHSLLKGKPHLNASSRFATYRSHPMTEKQKAILKRYKIDLQQVINKGQAMDLITRLKLGQGRIWRQQAAKAKQNRLEDILRQQKQFMDSHLRRTSPPSTNAAKL